MNKLRHRFMILRKALNMELREDRLSFVIFSILRALVVVVMILQIWNKAYEDVFLCIFTLILMLVPYFVEMEFRVAIPRNLEIIIMLFIFAAEILGEINEFYIRIPMWDTMLHTLNGFLAAVVGYSMVDLLNRSKKHKILLSPFFMAGVSFCFSMTIGVCWEFFEFAMDWFAGMDMQKDTVVDVIRSVTLNPDGRNVPFVIKDIQDVMVNGSDLGVNGYLDIGLIDTMADLFVNFVGAITFSTIGYIYTKNRDSSNANDQRNNRLIEDWIPTVKCEAEDYILTVENQEKDKLKQ